MATEREMFHQLLEDVRALYRHEADAKRFFKAYAQLRETMHEVMDAMESEDYDDD